MPQLRTQTMSFEQILMSIKDLSLSDMRKLNTVYYAGKDKKIDKRIETLSNIDLQAHIETCKVLVCPHCGSKIIVKNGLRNGIQRYKCKDCNTRFTLFTDTILEKTKFHWDFWIDMITMMLNNYPLASIKENLEKNHCVSGIHIETIFNWRHKIFEASKMINKPELEGNVEVDETYVREGQKKSNHLINPLDTTTTRKPRKCGSTSKLGVLGPEFGNIVCAIDHKGHVVAKVIGVGACSKEMFEQYFRQHILKCTWLCTDANRIYSQYANKYSMQHYVKPSLALANLRNGLQDGKTEQDLYKNQALDYIDFSGYMNYTYKQFKKIKNDNQLGLAHVNQFHNEIKHNIVKDTHGVSLKHLEGYVAWEVLKQNYKVDYGHNPTTKEDAEIILKMLLNTKKNIKVANISTGTPDFSNCKKAYTKKLNEITKKSGHKFDEEELGPNFKVREYLESLPIYKLKELGKKYKIKGYTTVRANKTHKLVRALEKCVKIENAI